MIKYIKLSLFCKQTGYTEDAAYSKMKRGDWPEGVVFVKAPDGNILINLEGYEAWAEGRVMKASGPRRAHQLRSCSITAGKSAGSDSKGCPTPPIF